MGTCLRAGRFGPALADAADIGCGAVNPEIGGVRALIAWLPQEVGLLRALRHRAGPLGGSELRAQVSGTSHFDSLVLRFDTICTHVWGGVWGGWLAATLVRDGACGC